MVWPIAVLSAALLFLSPVAQQSDTPQPASSADAPVPAEAAKVVNPAKSTPETRMKARKTYGYDCAMCHGKEGRGDGDLTAQMKLTLSDLSKPETLKDRTDGELFYILKHGKGKMPPEGDRGKEEDLW